MASAISEAHSNIRRLHSLLKKEGYQPDEPTTDTFSVKIDGYYYIIGNDVNDLEFFQMALPFNRDEDYVDSVKLAHACNAANLAAKMGKMYFTDSTLFCAVQVLSESPEKFIEELKRYVSIIEFSIDRFQAAFEAQA